MTELKRLGGAWDPSNGLFAGAEKRVEAMQPSEREAFIAQVEREIVEALAAHNAWCRGVSMCPPELPPSGKL